MNEIFERYREHLERNLNKWLVDNNYKPVKLKDQVLCDLMDEFLSFLSVPSEMESVMDEIDINMMLGEYDWAEMEEE